MPSQPAERKGAGGGAAVVTSWRRRTSCCAARGRPPPACAWGNGRRIRRLPPAQPPQCAAPLTCHQIPQKARLEQRDSPQIPPRRTLAFLPPAAALPLEPLPGCGLAAAGCCCFCCCFCSGAGCAGSSEPSHSSSTISEDSRRGGRQEPLSQGEAVQALPPGRHRSSQSAEHAGARWSCRQGQGR